MVGTMISLGSSLRATKLLLGTRTRLRLVMSGANENDGRGGVLPRLRHDCND